MRSNLPCSTCVMQSVLSFVHGKASLHASALSVTRTRSLQTSAQTRKPKHIASTATTRLNTVQKGRHASVATSKTRHPSSIVPQENLAASSYDLAPSVPYPENSLSSTRPAQLDPPDGPAKERDGSITLKNRGKYFYRLGKAYLGFYKTGFKNIWFNYKAYKDVWRKFGGTDIHKLVKYESTPKISRREFQLYLRTRHDLKKLIPFGLVFAICGEFTPLVILALGTSVVPYTCRIPKQVKKDLQKTLTRIEKVQSLSHQNDEMNIMPATAYVHGLDPLGLSLRGTPILGSLLWRFRIAPKLKQRMDDIICDAILIIKEGGASRLEPEELFQFCINIKKADAIKRLIEHYTSGAQSRIPDPDVKRTQHEVGVVLDQVRQTLLLQEGGLGYQPEAVYLAASEHARSLGVEGGYVPPGRVQEGIEGTMSRNQR